MTLSTAKAAEWTYPNIRVGQYWSLEKTFNTSDVEKFASLSGDFSPLHVDPGYASATEYGECVVHGMLLAALFSQLVGMWLPGKHALYLGQDLSFRVPVLVGETVTASGKVIAKNDATRTITLTTEIRRRDGKTSVSGTAKVKLRDSEAIASVAPNVATKYGNTTSTKVALVTGGSRGIGAEIARQLASRGATVAINYFRSAESADRLVHSIREAGGEAIAVQADVREALDVKRMVMAIFEKFGRLDWVVNCATGELHQEAFGALDWSAFESSLHYQTKAVIQVLQAVYPIMKAAGGGAVVNILSQVVGGQPPARMSEYTTAKYALFGLSKALAVEWADDNIRVNMVSPGLIQTDLTVHYPERVFKLEANRTPLKRIALTGDVASAVAYLLSDEASFLTGVNMFVTGGQVMS